MNQRTIDNLEELGWKFLPYSDEGWEWMKFDENKKRIARQGDLTWLKDLKLVSKKLNWLG